MRKNKLFVVLFLAMTCCGTGETGSNGLLATEPGSGNPGAGNGNNASNPNTPVTPAVCTPTSALTPDVNVVVTTQAGPNGFAQPIAISNNVYSMGIDDQVRGDYVPSLDPTFVSYLKALHPGMLRFPAGINGQYYTWATSGSGPYTMTPSLVDSFMSLCQAVSAAPFMSVNIETGQLSDAQNLVNYTISKNYNVIWWQIGNEPDEHDNWPNESTGGYTQKFQTYAQALRAINPAIKTVGGEYYTGESILGQHQQPDFYDGVMSVVGSQLDALDWHYYPLYSFPGEATANSNSTPSVAHLLQEDAADWPPAGLDFSDTIMPYLRKTLPNYDAGSAQIWIDEFAEDPGQYAGQGYSDRVSGALWAADAMGRYLDQGASAIFKFIFKSAPQNYYTLLDPNNNPRPEYYTYWLLANAFGDHMVNAPSDARWSVASHAALQASDGSLHVLLVNKESVAQNVHLTLADYQPRTAVQYNITGTSYDDTSVTLNGSTLNAAIVNNGANAIPAASAEACTDNTFTVPPFTITMLVFTK